MSRLKLNCWEYQGCGLAADSNGSADAVICPAATATTLDGIHGGKNGGRACWAVPETLCEGCEGVPVERKFTGACLKCAFYLRAEVEEGLDLRPVEELRAKCCDASQEAIGS